MALSRVPGDEELYIGGIFALKRYGALQAAHITHIVSVIRYDWKGYKHWQEYEHCSVPVDDVEDENLLGEFARTGKFIKEALQNGGAVLVHCAMGKSRSATVALAYLLSTRPTSCPDVPTALALIRETRPMVEPNPGFMTQLELYKAMGCPADIDAEPMYQRWLYKLEVDMSLAIGRAPDRLRFEDEESTGLGVDSSNSGQSREKEKELRCRKCRRTLATGLYLIPHMPKPPTPPSEAAADLQTGPISSLAAPVEAILPSCTHHFIHPLSWMRPTLTKGELAGRMECPNAKCAQQVGRYAWQGLKCSCGYWVVPGFSLAAGKVDEISVVGGKGGALGLRMPPGVKGSL